MIQIIVRGEKREVNESTSVIQLLETEKVEAPDHVGVAVNGELLSREDFDSYYLKDGDAVEIFYFFMGGSAK